MQRFSQLRLRPFKPPYLSTLKLKNPLLQHLWPNRKQNLSQS